MKAKQILDAPLDVKDHTLVVNAIMEHSIEVFRHLPHKFKKKGARPPGSVVLKAATNVQGIDSYTKTRIKIMLDTLPEIEKVLSKLPKEISDLHIYLLKQLKSEVAISEKIQLLRSKPLIAKFEEAKLLNSLDFTAKILEDGKDSIYSINHNFYTLIHGDKENSSPTSVRAKEITAGEVSDIDGSVGGIAIGLGTAIGGIAGGLPGAGVGGALGAVAGGGASAGYVIAAVIDWIFF